MVPEPDNLNVVIVQKFGSLLIVSMNIRVVVLSTIQLNGNLCLTTVKIEDKLRKRMLSAKTKPAQLPAPQTKP